MNLKRGLVLTGWEVKSLRAGKVNRTDAHCDYQASRSVASWCSIQPLPTADAHSEPDASRTRKLLLNRRELSRLIGLVERQGYTLIPLSLYWKRNKIKARIALAKGKKEHDKRETTKKREWERSLSRLMKQ